MKGLLVVFFVFALGAGGQTGGAVTGTVFDAVSGEPIPVALVTVTGADAAYSVSTKSGATGEFSITGIPSGSYAVCVQMDDDSYLDPCIWTPPGSSVQVADGQESVVSVQLTPAVILSVELLDPQNFLLGDKNLWHRAGVRIGVWGPRGFYHPAHATGTPGRYRIGFPRSVALKVQVASAMLKLVDELGAAVPAAGFGRDFRALGPREREVTMSFVVVGRAQ